MPSLKAIASFISLVESAGASLPLLRLASAVVALAVNIVTIGPSVAQVSVPPESLHVPKPSQDLSWAVGDWVAQESHPVRGTMYEWRVFIGSNGTFRAELQIEADEPASYERGTWAAVDRDLWSFTTLERDRKALALPVIDMYAILSITQSALELRHLESGKVLRLLRASTA